MHQNQVGELFGVRGQLGGNGQKTARVCYVLELIALNFVTLTFTKGQSLATEI